MTRLIDADALDYLTHRECVGHGEYYDMEIVTKVRIDNAPTIDAEPVMHGKWIEHDDGTVLCECSECNEKYLLYEEHILGRNFCPNCGAKMDKEGEE